MITITNTELQKNKKQLELEIELRTQLLNLANNLKFRMEKEKSLNEITTKELINEIDLVLKSQIEKIKQNQQIF